MSGSDSLKFVESSANANVDRLALTKQNSNKGKILLILIFIYKSYCHKPMTVVLTVILTVISILLSKTTVLFFGLFTVFYFFTVENDSSATVLDSAK